MSTRGVVLPALGVALLAAGFGLGVLVSGSREPVTITQVVPAPPAAPAAPAAPAPAAPAPAAAVAPEPAPPSASLSREDRDALRAILDRLPSDPVPTGTGTITGQVRTEDGNPVPGVEISFAPDRPRAADAARNPRPRNQPKDPDESAVESFAWARWHRDASRTATTDAGGRYRVEGLADAPYRGWAQLPGWSLVARPPSDGYRPGAVVDFIATPSIEVFVEVSCADGPLPEQLQLKSTDPRSGGWGLRADGTGSIRLKPGTYEFHAVGGVQQTHRSDPQTVEIPQTAVGPTLRFVLKGRPGIRGRVIFPEGQESDDASVRVLRLAEGARADAAAIRSTGRDADSPRQMGNPSFFVPDLPPGRYALGAARFTRGPIVAIEEVEVGSAQVERDIRMPTPDPAEYVAVTVLGPGGEVLRDWTMLTGWKSGGSSSRGGSAAIRRPDGSRWVFHHEPNMTGTSEGTYSITVTSAQHGEATLEYARGGRSEWTVRLEPPGRVEARVTGLEGTAYHGRLRFELVEPSAEPLHFRSGDSAPDASGLQTFPSIQPGEYVLVLLIRGSPMDMPIARVPVAVRGGRNEFSVPLPPLHEIVVTGAEGNVHMRSTSDRRLWILIQSTEGRAVFVGLPEGEYSVQSGRKQQTVRVSGPTKVDL